MTPMTDLATTLRELHRLIADAKATKSGSELSSIKDEAKDILWANADALLLAAEAAERAIEALRPFAEDMRETDGSEFFSLLHREDNELLFPGSGLAAGDFRAAHVAIRALQRDTSAPSSAERARAEALEEAAKVARRWNYGPGDQIARDILAIRALPAKGVRR